jgi:glycosyltransferase involved in cell wall biosynthesis
MRDGVRVSYILSTRNRADHLERALENARELLEPQDELIVVDGGSTDRTPAVLDKNRDLVSVFVSEPDQGEAHGLNRGLLRSRGRIIKQLTDDDYFYPDGMRAAIAVLEKNPQIDALVCGGEAHEYDASTGTTRPVEFRFLPEGLRLVDDVAHVLRYTQCGLGLLLKRRTLERVGLFDTTFRAVDTDYMARLLKSGVDFRYLNVKLFRHVTYPHSGQNREAECLKDRARVLTRSAAWSRIEEARNPVALAEALGLDTVAYGAAFARLIWYAEKLRRGPLGALLVPIDWSLGLLARGYRALRRLARAVLPGQRAASAAVDLAVEPKWDGSLR